MYGKNPAFKPNIASPAGGTLHAFRSERRADCAVAENARSEDVVMLMSSKVRRGSAGRGRDDRPAGILVLDRPPTSPSTQLRAYVWSRERADHSAMPESGAGKLSPFALMVGPMGSLPRGDWALAI